MVAHPMTEQRESFLVNFRGELGLILFDELRLKGVRTVSWRIEFKTTGTCFDCFRTLAILSIGLVSTSR